MQRRKEFLLSRRWRNVSFKLFLFPPLLLLLLLLPLRLLSLHDLHKKRNTAEFPDSNSHPNPKPNPNQSQYALRLFRVGCLYCCCSSFVLLLLLLGPRTRTDHAGSDDDSGMNRSLDAKLMKCELRFWELSSWVCPERAVAVDVSSVAASTAQSRHNVALLRCPVD